MTNNPEIISEYFDSIGEIYPVIADIVIFFFLILFKLHHFPLAVINIVHIIIAVKALRDAKSTRQKKGCPFGQPFFLYLAFSASPMV